MHIRTALKGMGRGISNACSGPGEGQGPIARIYDHLTSMYSPSLGVVLDVCPA